MDIIKFLYAKKIKEFRERIREYTDPSIIYVTDLISCPLKRKFRIVFPELAFQFAPALLLGDLVHKALELELKDMYKSEVKVECVVKVNGKDYKILGRADLTNNNEIVEIKTSRSGNQIPYEHHIEQLQIYMNLLGVDRGILLYITPDKIAEFEFTRKKIDIKKLVEEYLNRKEPMYDWECKYCPFSQFCSKKYNEL